MARLYILYSSKWTDSIREVVKSFNFAFQDHLSKVYSNSFTSNADDWQLFLLVENLTYSQARAMELALANGTRRQFLAQNFENYFSKRPLMDPEIRPGDSMN
ncbi:hypothetical protein [Chryseolinea sp. H1M3-3]|uniref:hypothetical protein n=1 Tax=Chryseolinea sp. H1M3-3 TaxID=3034144 RepID=UPI0023ECD66E|nr:hypothetical protein [Chryseolinea sp. H1M3-3]